MHGFSPLDATTDMNQNNRTVDDIFSGTAIPTLIVGERMKVAPGNQTADRQEKQTDVSEVSKATGGDGRTQGSCVKFHISNFNVNSL